MHRLLASIAAISWLAGCSWVDPTPYGKTVTLVKAEHVAHCKLVGKTTSRGVATLGPIPRDPQKVRDELATMAKNNAQVFGGDTIVAAGPVQDEAQTFDIYQCRTSE